MDQESQQNAVPWAILPGHSLCPIILKQATAEIVHVEGKREKKETKSVLKVRGLG